MWENADKVGNFGEEKYKIFDALWVFGSSAYDIHSTVYCMFCRLAYKLHLAL